MSTVIFARSARADANSTASQIAECEALAAVEGWAVNEVIIDTRDRTGYQRLMTLIDSGEAKRILVSDTSRLTRSYAELGELAERLGRAGSRVVAAHGEGIEDTPANRAAMSLLAAMEATHQRKMADTQGGRIAALGELICDWPRLTPGEITELADELRAMLTSRPPTAGPGRRRVRQKIAAAERWSSAAAIFLPV